MDMIRVLMCLVIACCLAGCSNKPTKPDAKGGVKDDPTENATKGWVTQQMEAQTNSFNQSIENATGENSPLVQSIRDFRRTTKKDIEDLSDQLRPTKPPPMPGSPGQPQVAVTVTEQPAPVLTVQQQVEAGVASALQRAKEEESARDAAAAAEETKVRRFEEAARRGAADAINQALPNIQEMLDQKMAALHEQGMDKNLQVTRGVIHQTLQEFYHSSQMKVLPELTVSSPPINVVRTTQYHQYFVPGGCATVWPYGYGGRVYWRVTPYNYYPYGR